MLFVEEVLEQALWMVISAGLVFRGIPNWESGYAGSR
jgi:hypothetical protein